MGNDIQKINKAASPPPSLTAYVFGKTKIEIFNYEITVSDRKWSTISIGIYGYSQSNWNRSNSFRLNHDSNGIYHIKIATGLWLTKDALFLIINFGRFEFPKRNATQYSILLFYHRMFRLVEIVCAMWYLFWSQLIQIWVHQWHRIWFKMANNVSRHRLNHPQTSQAKTNMEDPSQSK